MSKWQRKKPIAKITKNQSVILSSYRFDSCHLSNFVCIWNEILEILMLNICKLWHMTAVTVVECLPMMLFVSFFYCDSCHTHEGFQLATSDSIPSKIFEASALSKSYKQSDQKQLSKWWKKLIERHTLSLLSLWHLASVSLLEFPII